MNRIKIVRKYVSKNEVKQVRDYQAEVAKKYNRLILKIEAIDACDFFRANKEAASRLFNGWAHPQIGDYIVIVHYCMDVCLPNRKKSIKAKIKRAVKLNKVEKTLFPLKLDLKKKEMIAAAALSYTTNFSIPAYKFRHYSTITSKKRAKFEVPRPISHYRFAA